MNSSKIVKLTTAAIVACLLTSESSAIKTQSTVVSSLVEQAMNMVDTNSAAYGHLSSALKNLPTIDKPKALPQESQVLEKHSQLVNVPIDEKRALTLKVSPTFLLDEVNSVTLKSFRKIVGYDTFNSIRTQNRGELKDVSDYYNVTVSMMIRRKPAEVSAAPQRDPYSPDGAPSLAATLDKGFPYDEITN